MRSRRARITRDCAQPSDQRKHLPARNEADARYSAPSNNAQSVNSAQAASPQARALRANARNARTLCTFTETNMSNAHNARPVVTPAELIARKACCGACLSAVSSDARCACPCRGRYHGLTARADIRTLIDARGSGLHRLTDLEIITA